MGKLIGEARPTDEALQQMRERGGNWCAYQNHDLGSIEIGGLRFLQVGPGCTYQKPPERYPDTQFGLGWRYLLVGVVNLETGDVEETIPDFGGSMFDNEVKLHPDETVEVDQ